VSILVSEAEDCERSVAAPPAEEFLLTAVGCQWMENSSSTPFSGERLFGFSWLNRVLQSKNCCFASGVSCECLLRSIRNRGHFVLQRGRRVDSGGLPAKGLLQSPHFPDIIILGDPRIHRHDPNPAS
jgi:hypothetical protein